MVGSVSIDAESFVLDRLRLVDYWQSVRSSLQRKGREKPAAGSFFIEQIVFCILQCGCSLVWPKLRPDLNLCIAGRWPWSGCIESISFVVFAPFQLPLLFLCDVMHLCRIGVERVFLVVLDCVVERSFQF